MRPLILEMQNFGPYRHETVDFRGVDQEIFLITGPTGSGKTTIFDGICFALFGEGSGSDRKSRGMKSDFADPLDQMAVTFTFELQGRTWQVHRVPEQLRRKNRGDGSTLQKHDAQLYEVKADGEKALVAASVEEVRSQVRALLGLSAEQFRQIVMLPQGEFSQLLKAEADRREELLKSIFKMTPFTRIQERAGQACSAVRRANQALRIELEAEKKHFQMDEERLAEAEDRTTEWLIQAVERAVEEDQQTLNGLKDEAVDLQGQADQLVRLISAADQLNRQFDKLKALEAEREEQASQEAAMAERKRRAALVKKVLDCRGLYNESQKARKAADDAAARLKEKAAEKADCEQVHAAAEAAWQTVSQPSYDAAVQAAEDRLQQLRRLSDCQEEQQQLATTCQTAREKQAGLEAEWAALEQARTGLEADRQQLDGLEKDLLTAATRVQAAETAWQQLSERRQQLSALSDTAKELADQEAAIGQLRKDWSQAQKALKSAGDAVTRLEEAAQAHRAAVLARDLTEGTPCPVCGSLHHPAPAALADAEVTDGALEAARDKRDTCRQTLTRLETEGRTKTDHLKAGQERLRSALAAFQSAEAPEPLSELIAAADSALTEGREKADRAAAEKAACQAAIDRLRPAVAQAEAAQAGRKATEEALMAARAETNRLAGQLEQLDRQIATLSSALQDSGEAAGKLSEKINALALFIKEKKGYKETIRNQYQARSQELAAVKADYESVSEQAEAARRSAEKGAAAVQAAFAAAGLDETRFCQYADWDIARLMEEESAIQHYDLKMKTLTAQAEELRQALAGRTPADCAQDLERQQAVRERQETVRTAISGLESRMAVNAGQLDRVKALCRDLKAGEARESLYTELDDTLKGKVTGRQRISFERYILSAYLQDILEAANHFLFRMSGSRYRLEVSDDGEARSSNRGLGITVFDAYTGSCRSALTLSGGETFMAALAMALGLSETVQASAGGIVLDTLFIDEGFATLDPQALDSAISCLLTLQQDGRTIGIISHVEELKERIDRKICIEKGETGSRIHCKGGSL